MLHRSLNRFLLFLKKKKDLSFLNAAGVLFIAGVVIAALYMQIWIKKEIKENTKSLLTQNSYRDLNCIKPFTSLAGFNWKFSKQKKRKVKEIKPRILALPATIYKTSF